MPVKLSVLAFFAILLALGVYLVGDGWYSLLHYQRTAETFWGNNIFRWLRLFIGGWLIYMAIYFAYATM